MATVTDLRRIEFARGRRALSNDFILGDRFGNDIAAAPVTLSGAACAGFGAAKPPQTEAQHDGRGDDSQAGRRERRGAEERHRDGVLNCGRPRKRRHRERHRS